MLLLVVMIEMVFGIVVNGVVSVLGLVLLLLEGVM